MKQRLMEGESAPLFNVKDMSGNKVSLADYTGGYVLLAFLRYSGCPFCNLAIHRLALEHKMLRKNGCEVIAFVQSQKENIQRNIYERHAVTPPFPIIADPAKHIYEQYGVNSSVTAAGKSIPKIPQWVHAVKKHGFKQTKIDGDVFLVPAYFLVDARSGRVVRAHYGSSFYEHETFTEIYQPLIFNEVY